MDGYRTQLRRLCELFEQRLPTLIDLTKEEKDLIPPAIRALTLRRYAISRRDRVSIRLLYIQEALRMLDLIEGLDTGPSHLPHNHSRAGESRRRRATPSV